VLFSKVVKEERQVWRIPSQGGRAKPIGVSLRDKALYFLRTHPNGNALAFVVGDCDIRPHEVWLMENFLGNS
jgi:hypothetical protein